MSGYSLEMLTPGQIAALDPFGGSGLFLPRGSPASEIIGAVHEIFGEVPAVAWADYGAWISLAGARLSAEDAESRWASAGGR